MTVQELIEELQKYRHDATVYISEHYEDALTISDGSTITTIDLEVL